MLVMHSKAVQLHRKKCGKVLGTGRRTQRTQAGSRKLLPQAIFTSRRFRRFGPRLFPEIHGRGSRAPRRRKDSGEHSGFLEASGKRVLVIGTIKELAIYRAQVISDLGFEVTIQTDVDTAVTSIQDLKFDIAILSYTLPSAAVEKLADLVRSSCPTCPLITISEKPWIDRRIHPDAVAIADEGPRGLIRALRQVTQRMR